MLWILSVWAMSKRIRGRTLQRIRKEFFSKHPLCAKCLAKGVLRPATQLDHVIALDNGGEEDRTNVETNRQGLCDECHLEKTREDMGYIERPAIGLDGWPLGGGIKKVR